MKMVIATGEGGWLCLSNLVVRLCIAIVSTFGRRRVRRWSGHYVVAAVRGMMTCRYYIVAKYIPRVRILPVLPSFNDF